MKSKLILTRPRLKTGKTISICLNSYNQKKREVKSMIKIAKYRWRDWPKARPRRTYLTANAMSRRRFIRKIKRNNKNTRTNLSFHQKYIAILSVSLKVRVEVPNPSSTTSPSNMSSISSAITCARAWFIRRTQIFCRYPLEVWWKTCLR